MKYKDTAIPGGWGSNISRLAIHEGAKVVSQSLRLPLPSGNNPGTHFCWRVNWPKAHSAVGRIMSVKNSNDTIGSRTAGFSNEILLFIMPYIMRNLVVHQIPVPVPIASFTGLHQPGPESEHTTSRWRLKTNGAILPRPKIPSWLV
jgi:hypothetical protein